jgi:PAS domain S-box-containing protein
MQHFLRNNRLPVLLVMGLLLLLMQAQDVDAENTVLLVVTLVSLLYAVYNNHHLRAKTAQFEHTLADAQNQQRALDEHAIVSITDVAGNIIEVNARFEALSGYTRAELIGQNHRMVKSDYHNREFFQTLWQNVLAGKTWHGQILNRAKDGSHHWMETTIMPFMDETGKPYQYVAIRTDITAQKMMQDQIKASRYLLQNVMDTLGEGIYTLDAKGHCTYLNREAERMLGWTVEELMGKNLHDVIHSRRLDGSHLAAADCPVFLSMKNERIYRSENEYFQHKNGELFPVAMVASPISHGQGTVGSVAAFQDITERKKAEAELRRAKEAAEAASKAKGDFLATMSHEIRTPMNGIIGMTELTLDTELNSEQREYLELVRASADSLLNIINDILDFSKIESGKIELEKIDFQVRDLLASTLKPLSLRAASKGLELVYDLDEDVPQGVVGDPGRLRQVLTNLVGNAIKFSERGAIVVYVSLLNLTHEQVALKFSVSDQGVGIPQDKQSLIFEAFTQADTSTTRKYGGTGLGLAISSQLVQGMGGMICVESEEGQGSTFHFSIRLGVAQSAPLPQVQCVDMHHLPSLVVDDNATNRHYFEKVLKGFGLLPTAVESAPAALAEMARAQQAGEPYQLVLLDACMPSMDGFQLAEIIKNTPEYQSVKLLMLSSAGSRSDAGRCAKLGIARYLTKPVSQGELLECIENVLGITHQPPPLPSLKPPVAGGLTILLAEDNLVNQRLAIALLEKWGHFVEVAANGLEAVSKNEQQQFDLILMDVQMPDMGGMEATRLIRERECETGLHIPIIAMTANAMPLDRQICLEAGMDDYLSKPLNADKFSAMIQTFVKTPPMVSFDYDEALRRADREIVEIIAIPFLDDCDAQMAALQQAIASRHAPTLLLITHTFKGLVGSFNAEPVQSIAHKMEKMIEQGQFDALEQSYHELQNALEQLKSALRKFAKT